jgi:hypothetical protein
MAHFTSLVPKFGPALTFFAGPRFPFPMIGNRYHEMCLKIEALQADANGRRHSVSRLFCYLTSPYPDSIIVIGNYHPKRRIKTVLLEDKESVFIEKWQNQKR